MLYCQRKLIIKKLLIMKKSSKLFIVAIVAALVLVALICYFGFKRVAVLPPWGLISLIVAGVIMTVAILLYLSRKWTGAEWYD